MHKYYVHAIASLLSGSHAYSDYSIRHPLPPYAIHYALLLVLSRFFSLDLAEKIFICLIFLTTAYGFRYCAKAMGPSGGLVSLCMVPLILHWSLTMGFLNYSLAIGLFFLAAGLWIRASGWKLWLTFAVVVVILTLTHPVPLLLLIAFCGLDLILRMAQDRAQVKAPSQREVPKGFDWRVYGWRIGGLAVACLSFLYPLASADRSRSVSNLHATALHKDALLNAIALGGLSPFDTRATNPLILAYRLGLYAILIGSLGLALSGIGKRWRSRRLGPGDSMMAGSLAVLLAIPILPPAMNGSDYFATRLMIFPWLGLLAAAGAYAAPNRIRRIAPAFAVVMTLVTLLPAEIFFRPVARQLAALERQPLPRDTQGLAVLDPGMLRAVRRDHDLGFNPYVWGAVLPFLHADDVMLNSPWMDLTIMPLKADADAPLMVNEMTSPIEAEHLINGNINLPAMPAPVRLRLLASTKFIVYIATPEAIAHGKTPASGFTSSRSMACASHVWYLVCTL